ncbi:HNH endonuclease family protein [Klebsiella pneumoniae]
MIISSPRNWERAEVEHKKYLRTILREYYSQVEDMIGPPSYTYYFLRRVHRHILSRSLTHYKSSIYLLENAINKRNNPELKKYLLREIKEVINYDLFSLKSKNYNAYILCSKSKLRTCPYCNHAYTITTYKTGRGFRPSLDHFYDKARYPHLGLSLYNLVPSCSSCNSSLKNSRNFFKNPHLHPFFDDEEIHFKIKADNKIIPIDIIRTPISSLKIEIIHTSVKAANSDSTFLINERYQYFIYEAYNLALSKLDFDEKIKNKDILITKTMKEQTSLRFDVENYKNEMLGRLLKDIYTQFKSQ